MKETFEREITYKRTWKSKISARKMISKVIYDI